MRRSSEFDLCRTSAIMATDAVPNEIPYNCILSTDGVPNETKNDLRTYQIVYQTASRETVTEWHRETVETTTKR